MQNRRVLDVAANVVTGIVAVAAVGLAVLRFRDYRSRDEPAKPGGEVVSQWREYRQRGLRLGSVHAPVKVVEFSDFQCPYCKRAAGDLDALRKRYPTQVSMLYRHLPLHRHSFDAGVSAECAARAGRFEEYHNLLFAQSESLGVKSWTRYAAESGVRDTLGFRDCLQDRAVAEAVRTDSVAAKRLGVDGTPAILVGNVRYMGSPGLAVLDSVVRAQLYAGPTASR